jgi:hypothetical protein
MAAPVRNIFGYTLVLGGRAFDSQQSKILRVSVASEHLHWVPEDKADGAWHCELAANFLYYCTSLRSAALRQTLSKICVSTGELV